MSNNQTDKSENVKMCSKHPQVPLTLICIDQKVQERGLICGLCLSTDYMPYFKKILPIKEFLDEIVKQLEKFEDKTIVSGLTLYNSIDSAFQQTLNIIQDTQQSLDNLKLEIQEQFKTFKIFWQNKHPVVTKKAIEKFQDFQSLTDSDLKKYTKFLFDICIIDPNSDRLDLTLKQIDIDQFSETYNNFINTKNNKLHKIINELTYVNQLRIGQLESTYQSTVPTDTYQNTNIRYGGENYIQPTTAAYYQYDKMYIDPHQANYAPVTIPQQQAYYEIQPSQQLYQYLQPQQHHQISDKTKTTKAARSKSKSRIV